MGGVRCSGCGCTLSDYEVFAGRIRGLKTPICLGCLINAVVFLRDHLTPLTEAVLEKLEAHAATTEG